MTINFNALVEDLKKIPGLLFAFLLIAYGILQMKDANIGMHAWATLNLGLMNITNLNFGQLSQLIGLIIILFSLSLKIYPGMATILNMFFIGFFIDILDTYPVTVQSNSLSIQIFVFIMGMIVFNYGIYHYLKYQLGAGPRDGLMVGLVKITKISVTYIRPAIEITVLLIGYLLGGKVGIGTILASLTGGYILHVIFELHQFNPKEINQKKLTDYLSSCEETLK